MMTAETIANALGGHQAGCDWMARCPAHDDHNPSLSIRDAIDGKVLVHCHAGCSQDEVINTLRDMGLWHEPSPERIAYLKRQSLADKIRFNQFILATETQRAKEGYVHTEFERAQIRRAIRFLKEHACG